MFFFFNYKSRKYKHKQKRKMKWSIVVIMQKFSIENKNFHGNLTHPNIGSSSKSFMKPNIDIFVSVIS